jgi:hypothetical protein
MTAWAGTAWQSYNIGLNEGIDKYHGQCFHIGGIIIDNDGRAIGCTPLGQISREEMQRYKDNENKSVKPIDKSATTV